MFSPGPSCSVELLAGASITRSGRDRRGQKPPTSHSTMGGGEAGLIASVVTTSSPPGERGRTAH
jgi:hypothetical protein